MPLVLARTLSDRKESAGVLTLFTSDGPIDVWCGHGDGNNRVKVYVSAPQVVKVMRSELLKRDRECEGK